MVSQGRRAELRPGSIQSGLMLRQWPGRGEGYSGGVCVVWHGGQGRCRCSREPRSSAEGVDSSTIHRRSKADESVAFANRGQVQTFHSISAVAGPYWLFVVKPIPFVRAGGEVGIERGSLTVPSLTHSVSRLIPPLFYRGSSNFLGCSPIARLLPRHRPFIARQV